MTLTFSRQVAAYGGAILPLLETWRRRHEWTEIAKLPFILDDFVIGAMLLWGAWAVRRSSRTGRPILVAAWGVACGMGYPSFFSELVRLGEPDPSGVATSKVVLVKAVLLGLAILGMSRSRLRRTRSANGTRSAVAAHPRKRDAPSRSVTNE